MMVEINFDDLEDFMPFGKYKGQRLKDIPSSYLQWAYTIADVGWLKDAIRDELKSRGYKAREAKRERRRYKSDYNWRDYNRSGGEQKSQPTYIPSDFKEFALEIVSKGIKACALKYHPDKGGDEEVMKSINQAGEWLRKTLKG